MNIDAKILSKMLADNPIALLKVHQGQEGFITEMQRCVGIKTKIL